MNTSRILMAVLAVSFLGTQPIVATDQPKPGVLKREYRAFKDAIRCARKQGFSKCSRAQKTRVVIAGTALAAAIAAGTYGSIHWWSKKEQKPAFIQLGTTTTAEPSLEEKEEARRKEQLTKDLSDLFGSQIMPQKEEAFAQQITQLLERGADPNGRHVDPSGRHPGHSFLSEALQWELYLVASTLIKHGAHVSNSTLTSLKRRTLPVVVHETPDQLKKRERVKELVQLVERQREQQR